MAKFVRKTDPMVSCPYNLAHRMLASRLQKHLVKCKGDNPTVEKMICPFNETHLIDPDKYQYHLNTCEDRCIVDRQLVNQSRGNGCLEKNAEISTLPFYSEEWAVSNKPMAGYDPQKHIANTDNLVREVYHWKPAVRRQYYKDLLNETSKPNTPEPEPCRKSAGKESYVEARPPKDAPQLLKGIPVAARLLAYSARKNAHYHTQ